LEAKEMTLKLKIQFQICANLFWRGLDALDVADELESAFSLPSVGGSYDNMLKTTTEANPQQKFQLTQRDYTGTWYEENQRA
jgi:hypothetical protein